MIFSDLGTLYAVLQNLKFTVLLAYLHVVLVELCAKLHKSSEFRKLYPTANIAYNCRPNAEFMLSVHCTVTS